MRISLRLTNSCVLRIQYTEEIASTSQHISLNGEEKNIDFKHKKKIKIVGCIFFSITEKIGIALIEIS